MRTLVIATCLAASVSAAHALDLKSLTGGWTANGQNCSKDGSNDGLLEITEARFRYYEAECRVRSASPVGDALQVQLLCEAEGEKESRRLTLRLKDPETLVATQGRFSSTYKACRQGNASAQSKPTAQPQRGSPNSKKSNAKCDYTQGNEFYNGECRVDYESAPAGMSFDVISFKEKTLRILVEERQGVWARAKIGDKLGMRYETDRYTFSYGSSDLLFSLETKAR